MQTCDSFKVDVDAESDETAKVLLKGEWNLHKRKAKRAYQQLRDDIAESERSKL